MPYPIAQLTSEEHLLLSLCRLRFTDSQEEEIKEYVTNISDWDSFVKLSNEHGIIALSWHNLSELKLTGMIPAEFQEILHKAYFASLSRNTKIFKLLKEVLKVAEAENIETVLVKGLALESTVYENRGLRQMNDLDIVVRAGDAIRLRKALLKNGFVSQPMISVLHEKVLPSCGKHLPEMYRYDLAVEIHFKLTDGKGNILTEELIKRSVKNPGKIKSTVRNDSQDTPLSAASASSSGLNEEQQGKTWSFATDPQLHFLYLVKHLHKHESGGTSQLRLYADLVIILAHYGETILSGDLFEYAGKAGLEKALAEKLFLLDNFFGAGIQIPEPAEKEKIIEKFMHYLRHPKDIKIEDNAESLLKPMRELDGIIPKALYMAGYLFPSFTFMRFRYSLSSVFGVLVHYPVRWWKLVTLIVTGKV